MGVKENSVGLATAVMLLAASVCGGGDPLVPCFFIFGDSLSDSGNNNRLSSLAKANFLPYGIDFPGGPTGRFTNGRTTVDLIGKKTLYSTLPTSHSLHFLSSSSSSSSPFSSVSGDAVIKGVNYASGSSGILNQTGSGVGARIAMEQQLRNHRETISKITEILGKDKVDDHLNSCLYSVYAGSNDYMLNYYMSKTATSIVTAGIVQQNVQPPQQFTASLVSLYSQQLQTLYAFGARKVVVFGLGPLGCLPLLNQTGKCSDDINNALQGFNTNVRSLVDDFNMNLTAAHFIFVDTMKIVSPDLSALGPGEIILTDAPCCGVKQIFCLPYTSPCSDRNVYAFWDNAHPTEAANRVLADRAYNSQDEGDTYPMDISHLVNPSMAAQASNSDKLTLSICVILCAVLLRGSERSVANMSVKNNYSLGFAAALALLVCAAGGAPQVPCLFIFGDSLSDSGNNNLLASMAKANFLPYGIDFPGGPTGRFTNGRTTVDLVGDHLGLGDYILPLGCMPLLKMAGRCSDYVNNVLDQMFNRRIKALVNEFNRNFAGAQFIFVDTMRIMSPDLSGLGLTVVDAACCGCNELWCIPYTATVCLDRNDYAYWDLAHPTEAANKVLAARAYSARDARDAYPMDIKHLVASKASNVSCAQHD